LLTHRQTDEVWQKHDKTTVRYFSYLVFHNFNHELLRRRKCTNPLTVRPVWSRFETRDND